MSNNVLLIQYGVIPHFVDVFPGCVGGSSQRYRTTHSSGLVPWYRSWNRNVQTHFTIYNVDCGWADDLYYCLLNPTSFRQTRSDYSEDMCLPVAIDTYQPSRESLGWVSKVEMRQWLMTTPIVTCPLLVMMRLGEAVSHLILRWLLFNTRWRCWVAHNSDNSSKSSPSGPCDWTKVSHWHCLLIEIKGDRNQQDNQILIFELNVAIRQNARK